MRSEIIIFYRGSCLKKKDEIETALSHFGIPFHSSIINEFQYILRKSRSENRSFFNAILLYIKSIFYRPRINARTQNRGFFGKVVTILDLTIILFFRTIPIRPYSVLYYPRPPDKYFEIKILAINHSLAVRAVSRIDLMEKIGPY